MNAPLVIDLGVSLFQIGGSPDEQPPRLHLYLAPHDQAPGGNVLEADRATEPTVTLVFHNPAAVKAMARALAHTLTYFGSDVDPGFVRYFEPEGTG